MSETPRPPGQLPSDASPVGAATPVPGPRPGGSDPHPLSPLPPASGVPHAGTGLFSAGGGESGTTRSVALQELGADKLLLAATRLTYNGRTVPSLGGIPILAKLGQGGMGAVYFGLHPRLEKEVAVKVLPFLLAEQQPDLVQRFFREARIAARVQSPHLVGVMDVNEENGLFFLVMEYVHGETGKKYLQRILDMGKAGLEESVALEICIAAARGLAAAHAQNIVHRDIKPDNILIPWTREADRLNFEAAKVSDLGLARGEDLHQSLTGTQSAMGTPGYMSPEQAMDAHSAGVAADVFSLGATLYAFLSGRAPFTGASVTKIIFDTVQAPHPPLQNFRPDLSPNTLALVERCLRKNPAERFGGGAELLAALQASRAVLGEPEPTIRGQLPGTGPSAAPLPYVTPVSVPVPGAFAAPTPSGPFAPGTPVPASAALPAAYTPPLSSPSTLNPAAPPPAPASPGLASAPALPAAPPVHVPPALRRSNAWVALVLLAVLGAGGFAGWQYLEQKRLEETARLHREEVAAAVESAARAKTGGLDARRAAVEALAQVESKFAGDASVDLSAVRSLKAEHEAAIAQEAADRELEKALAGEHDPARLPAVLESLGSLSSKLKDQRGLDLSRLQAARGRVDARIHVLAERRKGFLKLLDEAEAAAKAEPDAALAKLDEAGRTGRAEPAEGLPDLLAEAAPRIETIRAQAQAARADLERKAAAARAEEAKRAMLEKFKRDYDLAFAAYKDRNYVLVRSTLEGALQSLGEQDHVDKKSAQGLLETAKTLVERSEQYTEALKKAEEALEKKSFEEARKEFRHASDLWPDAPQKDRVADGLKKAEQSLAQAAHAKSLADARDLLQQEKWDEAAAAYAKLVESDPQSAEAKAGLSSARYGGRMKAAGVALAGKHWPEAEQALNDALRERTQDPAAQRGLADVRYGQAMEQGQQAKTASNWPLAEQWFQKALAEHPGDPEADRGLQAARRYQTNGKYDEVIREGQKLLEQGHAAEAAEKFREALRLKPGDPQAQAGLQATQSTTYTLAGTTDWGDSGVKVKAGDRFKIVATGTWRAFPLGPKTGPSGQGGTANGRVLNRDDANHAFFNETLIGRIMGAQAPPKGGLVQAGPPPFYVGDGGVFTAKSDGTLQFRMNEENPLIGNPLFDNTGSLEIVLSVVSGSLLPTGDEKGRLGVAVQALTEEAAKALGIHPPQGALVAKVLAGSPAADAGLQEGDVILAFGGTPIVAPQDLVDASAKAPAGSHTVKLVRKGQTLEVALRVPEGAAQPGAAAEAYGAYEELGTFGVYSNRAGQGIPLDKDGRVIPIRTDLDKDQYDEAVKDRRSFATIAKGTKVRIEYSGTWYSGPFGAWVGADGKHPDGKDSIHQFRAFQGPNDSFNIAMLVVYISAKDKSETVDFARIAQAGQVWAVTDKNKPLEFVMPETGILRFQQNRDGNYDVTKGALNITVKVAKPK